MSANSKRYQPGEDDGGDARKHQGNLLAQPAFGDNGQAQDHAAGDLEGGLGDGEIDEYSGPAQEKEQHDGSGNGGALECGAQLSRAVLRPSHGKEDWRVADWVDHREIDDEGCDKTLEHGLSLDPRGAHCPHQNG